MKRLVLPALLLAGALSACGGDNGNDSVGEASPTPTPSPTPTGCPTGAATTDLKSKPVVVVPEAATQPTTTQLNDIVVGKGKTARSGSHVTVKYVGVLFATCEEFDSSWSRGANSTLPFQVDAVPGVIAGFNKGVTGMRVGGRRQIVIPPSEGYGDTPNGAIPGGSTLIFVVDLVSVS
jgi:peptidylprolyl isomerase